MIWYRALSKRVITLSITRVSKLPASFYSYTLLIFHHGIYNSFIQIHTLEILLDAQDAHGPIHPRPRVDGDEPPIIIVFRRMHALIRIVAPPREPVILGHRVQHHRVRRALAHLRRLDPRPLAARRDERARLPARQPGDVAQLGDGPAALRGVAVLDAGVEEAHAAVHHGGAVVRVDGDAGVDGLDAGEDAADGVGVPGRLGRGDAGGGHGGGRHRRVSSLADDTAHVVHDEDAGNGVGTVVEGGPKGRGGRSHMFWGEGCIVRPETACIDVEGV